MPQDQGFDGLYQQIQKLRTTGRLMHTTAHPDDEDGGMLTMEARGSGNSVLLMTLTRGEGGQNKFGSEIADELGVLRTLELLAADSYYDVDQRFSRVADFGFSKTADETFQKWGGHDIALADVVRVIRTYRPDVLVARFTGTERDGHGNHQASAIVTQEAFRAAADPKRFPDQIKQGLVPWQAKKLYLGMFQPQNEREWTLRLDTGAYDPILGMSYTQFALEGLSHQISQGVGGIRFPAGHRYTYYRLADSTLPRPPAGEHEKDFFDGIDTSLAGLATRLGKEEQDVPYLRPTLTQLQTHIDAAARALTPANESATAPHLLAALRILNDFVPELEQSPLSGPAKLELLTALRTKQQQLRRAADLALGLSFDVTVDSGQQPSPTGFPQPQTTFQYATPGQSFTVNARFVNRGHETLQLRNIVLQLPPGWTSHLAAAMPARTLFPGDDATAQFQVTVPQNAQLTRPFWHRDNIQQENVSKLDIPALANLPFAPDPVIAVASYSLQNDSATVDAIAQTKLFDPIRGQTQKPLAIAPSFAVDLEPHSQVISTTASGPRKVVVGVTSFEKQPSQATVTLSVPSGWKVDPPSQTAKFERESEHNTYTFQITPTSLTEKPYAVSAQAAAGGRTYNEAVRPIGRPDIGTYNYFSPAKSEVSAVNVNLPANLRVGYVMGAGDEIPDVLKQLGVNVELITAQDLLNGDLSRFNTIVLGIRAYDVRTDLRENNHRLLDYVQSGGTLIAQYNQSQSAGDYMPYSPTASRDRVSVEEAPITVLVPNDSLFHSPNQITAHDWDNWVQERGLYYLSKWDTHYTPLISAHDPGEPALEGGLLRAQYGKGTFIYTGLAFFRQLPAGVPGAIRLFANLLAAGHTQ